MDLVNQSPAKKKPSSVKRSWSPREIINHHWPLGISVNPGTWGHVWGAQICTSFKLWTLALRDFILSTNQKNIAPLDPQLFPAVVNGSNGARTKEENIRIWISCKTVGERCTEQNREGRKHGWLAVRLRTGREWRGKSVPCYLKLLQGHLFSSRAT